MLVVAAVAAVAVVRQQYSNDSGSHQCSRNRDEKHGQVLHVPRKKEHNVSERLEMEGQLEDHSRMTPGLSACLPERTEFSIQEINEWGRKCSGGGAESTRSA